MTHPSDSTTDLIAALSTQAKPERTLRLPGRQAALLLTVTVLYAGGCQYVLGFRHDLALQLMRPWFVLEVLLSACLLLFSMVAAVLAMYPDAYQKPQLLKWPYVFSALLLAVLGLQAFMPADALMVLPTGAGVHAMECAVCIASVALVPSALMFALLRRGAGVRPLRSGAFAVLTSSAVGCLTLRLAEANDSITHLVQWHYAPTLLFAAVGAVAGKHLLRW